MKIIKWLSIVLVIVVVFMFLFSWYLSRPAFDGKFNNNELLSGLSIAPIGEAITFAMSSGDVLLVLDSTKEGIVAINLEAIAGNSFSDSIDAYHKLGVEQLKVYSTTQSGQNYTWEQLGIPVAQESYPHIAAGTNYAAHAAEVGHTEPPFLFPKLSHISAWNADVKSSGRLDYEVELCAVPMTDHSNDNPAQLAYLLCGDFTDRWLLMSEMDIGAPKGPTGFPAGKGGETRFPVGFLLVVPEFVDFYKKVQMDLYVNDDLRQHAFAEQMIWSPEQILAETLIDCAVPYYRGEEELTMLSGCDNIPARTLILTGTPEGIIFKVVTVWNPFVYLQVGDVITSTATYLGFTRNTVK